MKFSVPFFPPDRWGGFEPLLAAMRRADELGFASVTLPDHLLNPIVGDPPAPIIPSDLFYDLFVLGAAIAAATSNLRLHISALIVPYRHPLLAAKAIATLDQFSKGRMRLTVAAGWMEQEFDAFGLDFSQRAALTDEYLEVMRRLWTEEDVEFVGRFVTIPKCRVEPKCYRKPHANLLGGGAGRLALTRVLKHCDGWAPMQATPEQLRPSLDWLRENAPAHGRDFDRLEFWTRINILGGDPAIAAASAHAAGYIEVAGPRTPDLRQAADEMLETVRSYQALGNFQELALTFPWRSPAEYIERLEWLAQDVIPLLGQDSRDDAM